MPSFTARKPRPVDGLVAVRHEVGLAGIELPAILAATKVDDAAPADIARLTGAFPDLKLIPVSILDDASLALLKDAIWRMTGLLRIYLRHAASIDDEPMALAAGASSLDVARAVHKDLAASFKAARVWGASARFDGQLVGRDHLVADGDVVEIIR